MLTIKIRKFRLEDIDLLKIWLEQDYIRKFWGEPQHWISEITKNIDADWVKYFIVECNHPIGFLQYYEADKAPVGEWSNEPKGTVGIDYLIGDKKYLGKGLGTGIVRLFIEYIQSLNKYDFIIADPVKENIASIKVLIKNGFELQDNGLYKREINRISNNEYRISK
jgi:RimJ/RimL family protein N-acetyltransferase